MIINYFILYVTRKWKEMIQGSKQCIKDFKSELLNVEQCEVIGIIITNFICM